MSRAARVSDIAVKQAVYGRLFITALLLMASVASALAYGWGGVLVVRHALDLGTVVALVSYLARLFAPLIGLSNIQVSIMTALVSFERVFEVLDLEPMIRNKPGAVRHSRRTLGHRFRPRGLSLSLGRGNVTRLPRIDCGT